MSTPSKIEELAKRVSLKAVVATRQDLYEVVKIALTEFWEEQSSEHEKQVAELEEKRTDLARQLQVVDHALFGGVKLTYKPDRLLAIQTREKLAKEGVENRDALRQQVAELTRKLTEATDCAARNIEKLETARTQLAEAQAARRAAEEKDKQNVLDWQKEFKHREEQAARILALEQVNGEQREALEAFGVFVTPIALSRKKDRQWDEFEMDAIKRRNVCLSRKPSPELLPKIIQVLQDVRLQYPDDIEAVNQLLRTLTSTEVKS
jgi:hypothetical protein